MMVSYSVNNFAVLFSGVGKSCPGCEENGQTFCNYDYGDSGNCEPCSSYANEDACRSDGLPAAGEADCIKKCFASAYRQGKI